MHFYISDTNPNNGIGGRGCVCNPTGCLDCEAPYAIFPASETDNNLSPHVVLGLKCARQFILQVERGDDALSAGEDDPAPDPEL